MGQVVLDRSLSRLCKLYVVLVLLAGLSNAVFAADVGQKENVLLMKNGAVILAHTGQFDKEFPVNAMIDGSLQNYWASNKPGVSGWYPQSFVIELAQTYRLETLVVDNRETDELDYPGVSAREIRFYASVVSPQAGWKLVLEVEAEQFARKEIRLEKPIVARWLKVEILSNFGNPRYTEINELEAYGVAVPDEGKRPDPSGMYQTNYRMLKLQVDGNKVMGCYEMDNGFVTGTTDGRVFDIEWIEHKGIERGTALLVLSSGGFLNGLWYEKGIMKGPWFGNKLQRKQSFDCDPKSAGMAVGVNTSVVANQ